MRTRESKPVYTATIWERSTVSIWSVTGNTKLLQLLDKMNRKRDRGILVSNKVNSSNSAFLGALTPASPESRECPVKDPVLVSHHDSLYSQNTLQL